MTEHIPQAKLKRIPPREESAQNAAALDEVARSLGFTEEAEARPRRWTMRIGALLQQVRSRLGLRQDETAKTAGITQSYLSRLENGLIQKRGPTIDVLLRWAEAANADIEFAVRSKKDGRLLGRISSKDLNFVAGQDETARDVDALAHMDPLEGPDFFSHEIAEHDEQKA
jgi:transcriptional regulator with XRE-family HTH domain